MINSFTSAANNFVIQPLKNVSHQIARNPIGSAAISSIGLVITLSDTLKAAKSPQFKAITFAISALVSGIFTALALVYFKGKNTAADYHQTSSKHAVLFSLPGYLLTASQLGKLNNITRAFFFNSIVSGIRAGSMIANALMHGYSPKLNLVFVNENKKQNVLPPAVYYPRKKAEDYKDSSYSSVNNNNNSNNSSGYSSEENDIDNNNNNTRIHYRNNNIAKNSIEQPSENIDTESNIDLTLLTNDNNNISRSNNQTFATLESVEYCNSNYNESENNNYNHYNNNNNNNIGNLNNNIEFTNTNSSIVNYNFEDNNTDNNSALSSTEIDNNNNNNAINNSNNNDSSEEEYVDLAATVNADYYVSNNNDTVISHK
jgi:hypothetical protein